MEITALRAQLSDLEEENLGLKEQVRKVWDEYESLVQNVFVACVHLKVRNKRRYSFSVSMLLYNSPQV